MPDWGLQVVNFVWFWGTGQIIDADRVFQRAFGFEAANVVRNKIPSSGGILSRSDGLRDTRAYSAVVQPGRFDLSISSPDEPVSGPTFWEIGLSDAIAAELLAGVSKMGDLAITAASRIAVHFRLSMQADGAEHANKLLAERIGLKDGPARPLDLEFQVNQRVRSTAIEGVQLNRLLKFSVGVMQEFSFAAGPPSGSPPEVSAIERYYPSLLLDVNTVPSGRELTHQEQSAIFKEMTAIAISLAKIGDASAIK